MLEGWIFESTGVRRWHELKGEYGSLYACRLPYNTAQWRVHPFRKANIEMNHHHADDAEQETH
jgi:hypothetical protein